MGGPRDAGDFQYYPLPARIYAGEGLAQVLFLSAAEPCETSYADRGGKYQAQRGITAPRM